MTLLVALVLAAAAPGPAAGTTAAVGTVQVARGVTEPSVYLIRKDTGASLRLTGAPVRELRNLQSATVEVLGPQQDGLLVVQEYRIVALAGGARPVAIGFLVPVGETGLGVSTDDGPPLPLNAPPRIRAALQSLFGAKVWIVGEKLLSGEIRVGRYGILLQPSRAAAPDGSAGEPGH